LISTPAMCRTDVPLSGSEALTDVVDAQQGRAGWSWNKPSPVHASVILFMSCWIALGPNSVVQGVCKDLYGDNAEWYYNSAMAALGVLAMFLTPFWGRVSDRYGRRPLVVVGALSTCLPWGCMYAFSLYESPEKLGAYLGLVAVMPLVAGGFSMFLPQAMVADVVPVEKRTATLGIVTACGAGSAWVIGPVFFAWFRKHYGLSACAAMVFGFCVLHLVIALTIPETLPAHRRSQAPVRLRDVNPLRFFAVLTGARGTQELEGGRTTTGVFRCLFTMILVLYIAKMGLILSLGLYAQQSLHFSVGKAAALQTTYGVFQAAGQLSIPLLIKPFSKRTTIKGGILCGVVSGLLIAVPHTPDALLFVSEGLLSLSFVAFTVGVAMASELAKPKLQGEVLGVMSTGMSISSGVGPMVFGIVVKGFQHTSYPEGAFLIISGFVVISLIVSFALPSDAEVQAGVTARQRLESKDVPELSIPSTV